VKYPTLYAPEGHKHYIEFNSIQRAHQNTLETWAPVMMLMMALGLFSPKPAAGLGLVWVVARFIYGYGYATHGPNGRMIGALLSYAGILPLMWMTGAQGARMANLI
jgi:glutathione S-transferase